MMRLMRTSKDRSKGKLKCALGLIGLLLVVVLMIYIFKFGHYYYNNVYPYHAIAKDIIINAEPEHQHLSPQIQRMIDADFYCANDSDAQSSSKNFQCGRPKALHITKLMQFHPAAKHQSRTLLRRFHEMLVTYFVVRPLSQNDQNIILSELTYFIPEAKGFNAFSQFYFHKPLSELTLDEIATLIAITKGPSYYLSPNAENDNRLKTRKESLLERYEWIDEK